MVNAERATAALPRFESSSAVLKLEPSTYSVKSTKLPDAPVEPLLEPALVVLVEVEPVLPEPLVALEDDELALLAVELALAELRDALELLLLLADGVEPADVLDALLDEAD